MLGPAGEFLSAAQGAKVLQIAATDSYTFVDVDALGKVIFSGEFNREHIDMVLALPLVDIEAVKAKKFKVVVDAVNSIGGKVIPELLRRMGVEVVELNCTPNGEFPHNPEPLPEHLTEIAAKVIAEKADLGVVVDPDAKLDEELIVRPTSETIIWNTYKNWIQSYRDLPLLINQWANVVRWEMRTRLFLRTAEFLWQEGHTAHATKVEALEEAQRMIHVYSDFAQDWMALPVVIGRKSDTERFAGAEETFTIEALMQDGKALQSGTSHFLAQNFAKAFDVQFANKEGKMEYVWATSWGVSTRLMGALIMAHSDNNGLVLPPRLAPIQVVLIPIYKGEEQMRAVLEQLDAIASELKALDISVKVDDRDNLRSGFKFSEWELKGVPVRLAMGQRDIAQQTVELARRDTLTKQTVPRAGVASCVQQLLDEIQQNIFAKALEFRSSMTTTVDSYEQFKEVLQTKGGFIMAHWDGTPQTEELIKNETKATIRCIPLVGDMTPGRCMVTGAPSARRVMFAKSY
ncbi:MAG: proline--tRNA ligase [Mucinivorans sp.]